MTGKLLEGPALGASLGLALRDLYELIKDVIKKARAFKSLLQKIESKLETLTEWVEGIIELTGELDMKAKEIRSFTQQKDERKKLLRKCSEIRKWNFYKKYTYTSKLTKLEADLQEFIDFFPPLLNTTVGLENRLDLKDIQATVHGIHQGLNMGLMNGGLSCTVSSPPGFLVGLDGHKEELKRQLLNKHVSVLLISAPGGCGKTTLVKKLCQDQDIKGKYGDNIFFVQVSETPNIEVIVSKLFDHMGYQLPRFRGEQNRVNQLEALLQRMKGSILLILDDVWSESFLDKFTFGIPNYQILVTSRTAFEGNRIEKYSLPLLNDKDAEILLRESANLEDGSSSIPEEHMKKILRECGGYPLALEVMGRSLRGQPPEAWQRWVENWSSGDSTIGPNREVLDCLKRSFDVLDDVVRECFLDLGLFPEDQRISVTALIDMWAELHKLDAGGLDAIIKLHEINSRHLASLVLMREAEKDVGKYYNEDFVLQHDLLRQLAINQSSQDPIKQTKRLIVNIIQNNLPEWWTKQKLLPTPINARILAITTDVKFCSSWCNIRPSKVEVLVLNFQTKNYTLPKFVKKMKKLKVLIVTNYGFSCVELRNFQLLRSASHLKNIRLEKVSIPSLCKALIQLKSLEKISFFMCNIGEAFRNFTIKISILLPKLMEINIDYCNDLKELPDELCESTFLKNLSITNCHMLSDLPQQFGELTNLEELRLRSCTNLLRLPESIRKLHKLSILDISNCMYISKLPEHIGDLHNLEKLHMEGCLRMRSALPPTTLDLEQLKLVTCDKAMAKSWDPIKEVLSNLHVKVAEKDVNLNWLLKS